MELKQNKRHFITWPFQHKKPPQGHETARSVKVRVSAHRMTHAGQLRSCPTLGPDQESRYKEEAELLKIEDHFSNVNPIHVYINDSFIYINMIVIFCISYCNKLL